MNRKLRFFVPIIALIAFCFWGSPSAQAQETGRAWAIKSGVGGIFTGHITGEVEVFLKGRVSVALRGALIHPNLDSLRGPAEGFFLKAGPKFYLSKEKASNLAGFALKPELVFQHFRDWEKQRGNPGDYWVNTLGLTCNLSYNLPIGNRFFLEPNIGIGYVPSFETYYFVNDVPPYEVTKQRWIHIDNRYGNSVYNQSHVTIYGDLATSGGLLVGLKF